jgi:hypothetical protein
MTRTRIAELVALALALGACNHGGQSGDEGSPGGAGSPGEGAGMPGGGMSGGGIGGGGGISGMTGMMPPEFECSSDAQCGEYVQDLAGDLERRAAQPELALHEARCITGCVEPTACACVYTIAGRAYLDAVNVFVLGGSTGCDVYGRAPYCLEQPDAFSGCEPDDPASCEAACASALDVVQTDAAGYAVDVRTAECVERDCRWVWRIDDRCFAGSIARGGKGDLEQPCALSDAEILERALAASTPDRPASPEEPNWRTRSEGGRTWATAEVCGQELEPVCVFGDCTDADVDAGSER